MSEQQVMQRLAWIQASDLIDGYLMNATESILSSPEMSREFIRGGGITADTIAEKAWELAVAMMKIRERNYRPREIK